MSETRVVTSPQAILDQPRSSSAEEINQALQELASVKTRFQQTTLQQWAKLVEQCIPAVAESSRDWVDAACDAKGIAAGSILRAEEITAGPAAALRYLRLLHDSLTDIAKQGRPKLPGPIRQEPGGRLSVRLTPVKRRHDELLFVFTTTEAVMNEGITAERVVSQPLPSHLKGGEENPKIALILGAGNVSSIPMTDTLTKIFQDGQLVLLKMNPVNEYLGPIFERALAPLLDAGFLKIIYGAAEAGQIAVAHELTETVHITGSNASYDAIVWGPPGPEHDRRKQEHDPLLHKPITSELGNVTPWIIVPGNYSEKQLQFQAENLAASIVNNASFNCLATKVIVTWKDWPDRERFLDKIQALLDKIPPRKAYYPGAEDRFREFAEQEPTAVPAGTLPWTLIRDIDPDATPKYLQRESFVCVCTETALEAESPEEFLEVSADFANQRMWGTLCAAVMVPAGFRKTSQNKMRFKKFIAELRYGAIGVNLWPGLVYGLMSPPWGGHPGSTLADPQSGVGWVHNTFLLEGIEKTVTESPLIIFPKPIWFPTHKNPEPIAWKLAEYYTQPSLWNLGRLLCSAVKNGF